MIAVRELYFRYPEARDDALMGVDWEVEPGAFTLVAGQSGSGKSTLLRCLNGLIPHFHGGYFGGEVTVFEQNTRTVPPRELAGTIGTVFQDPETQLVTASVDDELSFTLENLGYDPGRIRACLDRICRDLDIAHLRGRRITTLSGGERQLVALAAALAPEPQALVLDEPTSQLDPTNSSTVIERLTELAASRGLTVILAEHRLARLLPLASSVAHIQGGRLTELTPRAAEPALGADGLLPSTVQRNGVGSPTTPGDVILTARGLDFAYGQRQVLRGTELELRAGEKVALSGPNGSGKTTLLKLLIGLLRPERGTLTLDGRATANLSVQELARSIGYVPQHPTIMLHQETVADELRFTLAGLQRTGDIEAALAGVGLTGYARRHPLDLSGGERQRAAIAAIAVGRPRLLLLDEPTRGLPWSAKHDLAGVLHGFATEGMAIVVATHDDDFRRLFASRAIHLSDGRIASDEQYGPSKQPECAEDRYGTPLLTGSNLD